MANLKDATDNGTLLALGLVGVVAAAGAVATRGSGSAARGSSRSVLGVVHVDDPYEDTRPRRRATSLETGASRSVRLRVPAWVVRAVSAGGRLTEAGEHGFWTVRKGRKWLTDADEPIGTLAYGVGDRTTGTAPTAKAVAWLKSPWQGSFTQDPWHTPHRESGSAARGSSRSVLGVVHVDDPYEDTRPGWYVTNLETGAPLAGPFRSSGLAKERQRRLEQRGRA